MSGSRSAFRLCPAQQKAVVTLLCNLEIHHVIIASPSNRLYELKRDSV